MRADRSAFWHVLQLLCLCFAIWLMPMPKAAEESVTDAVFSVVQEESPVSVRVLMDGEIVSMELETYLVGVVLAEMPASFEMEALKAQAIAARTYAYKLMTSSAKHPDGAVCTDAACCQGYLSADDYLKKTHAAANVARIQEAVKATDSLILTFQGDPIEATFFSCSGGYTEDAAAVWGQDYPYLRAKESPGEEDAFCYEAVRMYTKGELETILNIHLDGDTENWFCNWEYTKGGGVHSVMIGGKSFSGRALRRKLCLNSTIFSVQIQNEEIVFTTMGYGHRVGMSQYGANAMAEKGNSFVDILFYYYDGAELEKLDN